MSLNATKLHEQFLEYLSMREPNPTCISALLAVVEDVWQQKQGDSIREIRKLQHQIECLRDKQQIVQQTIATRDFGTLPRAVFEQQWHEMQKQIDRLTFEL